MGKNVDLLLTMIAKFHTLTIGVICVKPLTVC